MKIQVPATSGQVTETDLEVVEIVGVLESSDAVNRFDKGLVATRSKAAALLLSSEGGWILVGAPPIHRQTHTEMQRVLVLLFVLGRGRRFNGLPLKEGFGHGQEHVGGGGHGCLEAT